MYVVYFLKLEANSREGKAHLAIARKKKEEEDVRPFEETDRISMDWSASSCMVGSTVRKLRGSGTASLGLLCVSKKMEEKKEVGLWS